ncbi:heme biosynthesis protein HemY [Nitratireductor aquimarinus]|uniref:heme biosynthesis protein HemY n=1 Tax=Alphaproteobacteria TaxID=28211 RepID=UPI0019D3BF96|nr:MULTISPECIES: heme biosynthesis protein HemY [Alphaproteobacteria]MBN7757876.1 heme biosynthesis protein HemY [Nitratireductor aquimarinus]MBY6000638.1 heme biosynthesis protein HemY [Tritonibacter mobilis]MBY6022668.1 heme biosynthesis protein HemY [Nitratireductor sp. DP7N14-4]
MFRILFYLVVVFVLGLGFAWLAERPGDLAITFSGYRYEVSLMVAAVGIVAIVAAVMILWWLIRSIWTSPYTVARYFRVRRRDRGYQALSTGMIAAGAGDGGLARRMSQQAAKLISADQEPLIHLLDAQAALLDGDRQAARDKFTAMLDDPEMRLLGLRGLYLEAERLGERDAARHYAERAVEAAPQLEWAVNAALEGKTGEGEWDGALKLLDSRKATGKDERESVASRRAVLLTAKAMDVLDADPQTARTAALEAHKLRPDFVPAAVTAARALFRQNELRKGSKVLETVWKKEAHPEIADVYIHARPGDSTHDRLARAKKLQSLKRNNVESALIVGRAALDAGEFQLARESCEAAARLGPRESVYLLMADIEEAETGDQGRVRQWLAKALRAPRDPAWVADGYVAERWAPISPVTGKLDAFEWRMPMERLAQVVESEEDFSPAPSIPAPKEEPETAEAETVVIEAETVKPEPAAKPQEPEKPSEPSPETAKTPPQPPEPPANPAPVNGQKAAPEEAEEPVKPPIPDDPGVEPDDKDASTSGRFRLF